MSSKKSHKWINKPPYRANDSQFMERAEHKMQQVLNGNGGTFTIAEIFKNGYPIENFRVLLESDDIQVLRSAVEACYEIGKFVKCYIDDIAEIMNRAAILKHCDTMVWLAEYAEEENFLADWTIVSFLDEDGNDNYSDTLIALRVMSGIRFGVLRGAKQYLLDNIPHSPHIRAIEFYLDNYQNEEEILKMLKIPNILMQRYAVSMASRFFHKNSQLSDEAKKIDDKAIQIFVHEKLHRFNFYKYLYR